MTLVFLWMLIISTWLLGLGFFYLFCYTVTLDFLNTKKIVMSFAVAMILFVLGAFILQEYI